MKKTDEPFQVTNGIRELAKKNGWPDPDQQRDAFVDHWEAVNWIRKGGVKITNREAAFRTWLRNQAKWNREDEQDEPKRAPYWDKRLG